VRNTVVRATFKVN